MSMEKLIAVAAVAASMMLPSYAARTVEISAPRGRSFRVEVDEDGEGTDGLRFIPSGFLMIVK